jgi:hypothetical protein
MTFTKPNALDLYRNGPGDSRARLQMDRSQHELARARDALTAGLRLLERAGDRGLWARGRHAQAARGILAEAVLSLATAAVHVPGLRTFTTDVIFAEHADVNLELRRLHQITTELWWHNSPRFSIESPTEEHCDDRLDELMRSYVSADEQERATTVAKTTASITLLAVGAAFSPEFAVLCFAALSVRSILRN